MPILTVTLNAAVDKIHLIPDFAPARVNRPATTLAMAGGKGVNVARLLTTLGVPTLATGWVAGHSGLRVLDCLDAEGLNHDFIRLPQGESRICLAIVRGDQEPPTEINEPGPVVGPAEFAQFASHVERLAAQASHVVLSGSLPPGLPATAYLDLMAIARAQGAFVSIDTSGPALAVSLAGRPDLLKPNQDEAAAVLGSPVTPARLPQAVAELLARGPQMVALSLGPCGAAIATADERWFFPAPRVEVLNPIGSGDAFLAALIARLAAGAPLCEAGRWAVAAGTANTTVAGPAACSSAMIDALIPDVRALPLDEAADTLGTILAATPPR